MQVSWELADFGRAKAHRWYTWPSYPYPALAGKVDHLVYPQGRSAVSLHFSYLAIVAIPRKLAVAGGRLTLENFETV